MSVMCLIRLFDIFDFFFVDFVKLMHVFNSLSNLHLFFDQIFGLMEGIDEFFLFLFFQLALFLLLNDIHFL